MKRLLVALTMCVIFAAGELVAQGTQYVLDLSGKITSLSGAAAPHIQPQTTTPVHAAVTQISWNGYLIVNASGFAADSLPAPSESPAATFVLVDSKDKQVYVKEDVPVEIWSDGKTVMVCIMNPPVTMLVTFGSIAFNGPLLKSLSTTGGATSADWYDPFTCSGGWPAYGSISLRNDRLLTMASLAIGNGEDAVLAYLHAQGYNTP